MHELKEKLLLPVSNDSDDKSSESLYPPISLNEPTQFHQLDDAMECLSPLLRLLRFFGLYFGDPALVPGGLSSCRANLHTTFVISLYFGYVIALSVFRRVLNQTDLKAFVDNDHHSSAITLANAADVVLLSFGVIMYLIATFTLRRAGKSHHPIHLFGALFDSRHDALLRSTRIRFAQLLRTRFVPTQIAFMLLTFVVILTNLFLKSAHILVPCGQDSQVSQSVFISAPHRLFYELVMIPWGSLVLSISFVMFGLVMMILQAHLMAVETISHAFENRSEFDALCQDLSSSSSSSPSSSSSSFFPFDSIISSSMPSKPSSTSPPAVNHIDPLFFALNALRRNRSHLAVLSKLGLPLFVATIVFHSWGSILYLGIMFASFAVYGCIDITVIGILLALPLLAILFQMARLSRAHQLVVETLCSEGSEVASYASNTAAASDETSSSTSSSSMDSNSFSSSLSSTSSSSSSSSSSSFPCSNAAPPMSLLQSKLEKHSWLVNLILATQNEDNFQLAGVSITMLTTAQLANYFVLAVLAIVTLTRPSFGQ